MSDPADDRLAAQYEAHPYPQRDPREEARRLVIGSPSHLREVDHWVFAARRPASRPVHALVAGGGTGDGAIMLAQQLALAHAEDLLGGVVVYSDADSLRSLAAHEGVLAVEPLPEDAAWGRIGVRPVELG